MKNHLNIVKYSFILVTIILLWIIFTTKETPTEYDCDSFTSYGDALAKFKENEKDIYGLDRNNNGIPCEILINKQYVTI